MTPPATARTMSAREAALPIPEDGIDQIAHQNYQSIGANSNLGIPNTNLFKVLVENVPSGGGTSLYQKVTKKTSTQKGVLTQRDVNSLDNYKPKLDVPSGIGRKCNGTSAAPSPRKSSLTIVVPASTTPCVPGPLSFGDETPNPRVEASYPKPVVGSLFAHDEAVPSPEVVFSPGATTPFGPIGDSNPRHFNFKSHTTPVLVFQAAASQPEVHASPSPVRKVRSAKYYLTAMTENSMRKVDNQLAHMVINDLKGWVCTIHELSMDNFTTIFIVHLLLPAYNKNPPVDVVYNMSLNIFKTNRVLAYCPSYGGLQHQNVVDFVEDLRTSTRDHFELYYFHKNAVKIDAEFCEWTTANYKSPGGRRCAWGKKGRANAVKIVQTFRTLLIILRYKQLYPENMVSAAAFRIILNQVVSNLLAENPQKNYQYEADMHFDFLHRFYNSFVAAKKLKIPARNKCLILSCAEILQFDGIRVTFGGAMVERSEIIESLYLQLQ